MVGSSGRELISRLKGGIVGTVRVRTRAIPSETQRSLRSRMRRRDGLGTVAAEEAVLFDLCKTRQSGRQSFIRSIKTLLILTKS